MEQAGAPPVIDGELAAFLEGGVAVFAASADPDKVPDATRVWGSAPDGRCLRILVATSATEALANLAATGRVAVCFTDVVTYRSVQLKGRVTDLPARAAPGDVALWKRYQDRFFAAAEGILFPRSLTARLLPEAVLPVVVEVDEIFDQTPGPVAGRPIGTGAA